MPLKKLEIVPEVLLCGLLRILYLLTYTVRQLIQDQIQAPLLAEIDKEISGTEISVDCK